MKIYMIGQKGIPGLQGGVETHVEELAQRLAKEGHEVFVYCRKKYTDKHPLKYKRVNLIYLPTVYSKHLEAIVHSFLASLDVLRRQADIIHYHAIGPASLLWIPRLFKRSAKVIFTYHCQDYNHQKWGWFAGKYLRFGEWVGCRFAHKVITVSKALKEYVKQNYGVDAEYVPNGVPDLDRFQSLSKIDQWGLKKDGYILIVSRFVKHKGIHYLIRAYNRLKTNKKLVIVGDGAYTDDYKAMLIDLAADNPNIIFTGKQTGKILFEMRQNAYCFIQPSEAEGLSVALLEAMRSGLCCLVSDIPENKEVIGQAGILFKSKDVDDLKNKLNYCLNNPKLVDLYGRQAMKKVKSHYNWDMLVKRIEAVYI